MGKTTFALFFGNRGFFPADLIAGAREELSQAVVDAGCDYIMPPVGMTRYGAVETREEGRRYAVWLEDNRGKYDGVIVCLPNFGDENGAVAALIDCGTPILLQAYPDEVGKMDPARRRDAYCGKFSIADVFHQYRLPFTMSQPHVVRPGTTPFKHNLDEFAATCRTVRSMRRFSIGCVGARTTAFKTVRFDEITLQKHGITVESLDLSDLFRRVRGLDSNDKRVAARKEGLIGYTDCRAVPEANLDALAKVGVVLDQYVEEYRLQALAIRCWEEMQRELRIAPCVLLGELNNRGVVASCEIDICSAVTMHALQAASEMPAACLDWNNNFGDDPDKVILFHCGPTARSLMREGGGVSDHKMFSKTDPGCGWGSDEGRIAAFPTTLSNCKTEDGKLSVYVTEGRFTGQTIEPGFFGSAGVCTIPNLQPKLVKLGQGGFRHHTTVGVGHIKSALDEAFGRYLGYDVVDIG